MSIFAQEYQTPDFLTLKTEKGLMIVNNNKPQTFAFLLEGKDFTSNLMDNRNLRIIIDGERIVFVTFVNHLELFDKEETADTKNFLNAQQTRELRSLTQIWEQNIKAENESFATLKPTSPNTLFIGRKICSWIG